MIVPYHQVIEQNPAICSGLPVIRGTRVFVKTILASLAEGATIQQILEDFPSVTEEQL
jgi:uncharacterized protein (DUF433 family)